MKRPFTFSSIIDKKREKKGTFAFIVPMLLCLLLTFSSLAAAYLIEKISDERCFSILKATAEQGASDICLLFESEEEKMQLISSMLSGQDSLDAESAQKYLDSLDINSLVYSFSLLLPDGTSLYSHEQVIERTEAMDFQAEKESSLHLSEIFEDADGEKYVAYICPVKKDGEAKAILYGNIKLSRLPEFLAFSAFDGQCQMYLVDGETGDLLMDTWHSSLGNFYEDDLSNRKTKRGTSFEASKEDFKNNRSGYVIFTSETAGEDFYSYYAPVGKENLTFQITVSESVAFADARRIRRIVFVLCGIQLTACLLYLFLHFNRTRRKSITVRRHLELSRTMNKVDQMLLGAYKNPWLVNEALKEISDTLGARMITFAVVNGGIIENFFSWPVMNEKSRKNILGRNIPDDNPEVWERLRENKSFILSQKELNSFPALYVRSESTIHNLAAACAVDIEGNITALLSASNVKNRKTCGEILETAAKSFQTALQVMESYRMIHEMGTVDSLTGLKNRNAYERQLTVYANERPERFCCVYIDANGLHDINNRFGHTAGDKMLRTIALQILEYFGFDVSYRIGGDEFVILYEEPEPARLSDRIAALKEYLKQQDYYISVGWSFLHKDWLVQQMIQDAEKRMYKDKKEYYNSEHNRRENRELNRNLEKSLMKKKDQESFLRVISANYLGVYAVNLDIDDARVILQTDYFSEILRANEFCFRASMRDYARRFVLSKDFNAFMRLLDYSRIDEKIRQNHSIESSYHKEDGTLIRVRILPMEDYTEKLKNSLWIFEICQEQTEKNF